MISSLNHVLNLAAPTLVGELREAWLAGEPAVVDWPQRIVSRASDSSFIVLGDPGEQDKSQFVVAPKLADVALSEDPPGFMVICSDVIYPSGDVNDYADGYYIPYREFPNLPVFALPGNHDWYDGLSGFMWHFCDRSPLEATAYGWPKDGTWREGPVRLLWRRPSALKGYLDLQGRRSRRTPDGHAWHVQQPGSYFAIKTKHLLVVCIDTGIEGDIDEKQGDWLLGVSRDEDLPKVLLTGKPLIVDNEYRPCHIGQREHGHPFRFVDDIVRHPEHRYVAAIGGDIHNFQRYEARVAGGRRIDYIVSGGGGAYMSATHPIGYELHAVKGGPAVPKNLWVGKPTLYPNRAESLGHFARQLLPRLWRLVRSLLFCVAGVAAAAAWIGLGPGEPAYPDLAQGTAVFAGVLLGLRTLAPRSVRDTEPFRAFVCVLALVAGTALGFTAAWLDPRRFGWDLLGWGAITVGGSLLAWGMRRTGWWRERGEVEEPKLRVLPGLVCLIASVALGLATALAGDDEPVAWIGTAVVLTAVAAIGGWLCRKANYWSTSTALAVAVVVQFYDALAVVFAVAPGGARDAVRWAAVGVVDGVGIALLALVAVFCLAGLAALLRSIGNLTAREAWGRVGGPAQSFLFLAFGGAVVGYGFLLSGFGHRREVLSAAVALLAPGGIVFGLDWARRTTEPRLSARDAVAATAVLFVLAERGVLDTAVAIAATVGVAVMGAALLVYARDRMKAGAYKLDTAVLVCAALTVLWHYDAQGTWVPRAAAASLLVLVATGAAVVILHLSFLGAYKMPFDCRTHADGEQFDEPEIAEILEWRRTGGPDLSDKKIRRRADIVFPGIRRPHGPLQQKVAEVFDSDEPPFYKNFLVLSTTESELTITLHRVTGGVNPATGTSNDPAPSSWRLKLPAA